MSQNQYLASELSGLSSFTEFTAAPATAGAAIDELYLLISQEHTTEQRGHLDEMSPAAHRQLLVELNALKDLIGLYIAP